jgi:tetratricopeptide (TPR) repeat protein
MGVGQVLSSRNALFISVTLLAASGCVTTRGAQGSNAEVRFEPEVITGDLELEKLNDVELFAAGTSYYGAEDFVQAARYFGRLADFFPQSTHRRAALYNAGLALEKLKQWEDAYARFLELSDPAKGSGDALDAAFRVAETLYHLERFSEAAETLLVLSGRLDLTIDRQIEAKTQLGICQLEAGRLDDAESTLRKVVTQWNEFPERDVLDDYFPAQAQFFLGEIYRQHYEAIALDPDKGTDALSRDLEYKAELLLSSQGHYLRSIRIGNGYWATAAGARIGGLYENLYDHMVNAPAPKELNKDEADVYRQELRKKIRVLLSKSITVYERTIEAAERIGANNPFVERTRESLRRMKELLLADARAEEEDEKAHAPSASATKPRG